MKRLRDWVLAAILLGAAAFGAYEIGHRVDHLSNQASSQDSELNGTTTTGASATQTATHGHTIDGRHITPLLVGVAVAAVLLAFVLAALVNAAVKGRKRERWRVS
jgi:hypothetical protein